MANSGDSFIITLKETHLKWGEYRNPTNREPVVGESYIPIPKADAEEFNIYNSNYSKNGLGYNLFTASSVDGYLKNVKLLAQGSSKAGDVYAKQFAVCNDLKKIGEWYRYMSADVGDKVRVTFITPTEIELEIL